MAHYDIAPARPQGGLARLLVAPLRALWHGLVRIADTNARVRRVEKLSALSDAELARRGLRRDEIVREVFLGSGYC